MSKLTYLMRDFASNPPVILDFTAEEIAERDKANKLWGFLMGVVCTIVTLAVISAFL